MCFGWIHFLAAMFVLNAAMSSAANTNSCSTNFTAPRLPSLGSTASPFVLSCSPRSPYPHQSVLRFLCALGLRWCNVQSSVFLRLSTVYANVLRSQVIGVWTAVAAEISVPVSVPLTRFVAVEINDEKHGRQFGRCASQCMFDTTKVPLYL